MASPLFKFNAVPISDIRPGQIFDVFQDGRMAIFPMRIDTLLVPGKVLVVGIDYSLSVYDADKIVYVLHKKTK